jgi:hypothetical protein
MTLAGFRGQKTVTLLVKWFVVKTSSCPSGAPLPKSSPNKQRIGSRICNLSQAMERAWKGFEEILEDLNE